MIQRSALTMAIGVTTFIMTIAAVTLYQLSAPTTSPATVGTVSQPANSAVTQPVTQINMAAPVVALTPEQAAAVAMKSVPNARLVRTPELVDFQGTTAYEVTLSAGLVYVDANTGRVLHNGALPARGVAQQRGEREHGSEHGSFFGSDGGHDED